jgi:pyrroline-5-carboxylate reductase
MRIGIIGVGKMGECFYETLEKTKPHTNSLRY